MLLALSVISPQGASMGSAAHKIFDARGGSIGRLHSNDWALPDPERFVSSKHAVVRFAGGAFCLEDVSTNGTFLNGPDKAVARGEPARLKDGDRLFIGDYEILVQLIDDGVSSGEPVDTVDPLAVIGVGAQPVAATPPVAAAAPAPARPAADAPAAAAPSAAVRAVAGSPSSAAKSAATSAEPARDLYAALGLDPRDVDPALASQLGAIVRTVVQGMIDVLHARGEVKNSFRMPVTSIRAVENNPLKFSLDAADALHNLFVKRNPGYLGAVEAFEEAFQDIAFHQLAMLAGIRAAYQSMLAKFSPAQLEEAYMQKLRRTSVLPIGGRLKLWDMYCAQFGDIEKDSEASFQLLFGEEFARAYHEQLEKLAQAARLRHRKDR